MQIGTLQDEEEEGAGPPPDKPPELFSQSALGTYSFSTLSQQYTLFISHPFSSQFSLVVSFK